jgi:Ca2+-dependent lipid-binding protein
MDITTPALLFPAISLLLLAYTNRFVVLTGVIRSFAGKSDQETEAIVKRQVESLEQRLDIIRNMQIFGVTSFIACSVSMLSLFMSWILIGKIAFGMSLLFLLISLIYSLWELRISTIAIQLEIDRIKAKTRS